MVEKFETSGKSHTDMCVLESYAPRINAQYIEPLNVYIFDFPRKRRCLYFTLSFTHLLRLKHQWFTLLNTCRI